MLSVHRKFAKVRSAKPERSKVLDNDEREVLVPKSSTESRAASCVGDCADTGWPAGLGPRRPREPNDLTVT